MKNYLSKIEKYIFKIDISKYQDYILNLRKKNPFVITISSIVLIFLLLLYFTIPTFYNYENFEPFYLPINNLIDILPNFLKNILGIKQV